MPTSSQTWVFEDALGDPVLIFLLQLAIVLFLTRLLGFIFQYLKQPQVIGEIVAGILLGPSVFGHIPGFSETVFGTALHSAPGKTYDSTVTFNVVANIGLILFMFLTGTELDRGLIKRQWKLALPIAMASIAVPFGIGCAISVWLQEINAEGQPASWVKPSFTGFVLFSGASMSFTAFPVLASILTATGLVARPLGVLAMSTAAIDDVLAWSTLAIASSFAKSGSAVDGVYIFCMAILYAFVMLALVKPALSWLHSWLWHRGWQDSRFYFTFIIILLLGSAYCTQVIQIHAFFGAFVAGIVVPKSHGFADGFAPKMELVVTEVLLPLFFASSGIKTNIGTLDTGRYWGVTVFIITIAVVAKFIPACLMTKLFTRRSWRFCVTVGVLMNTRGLVELIALNVGLQLGLLSTRLFTMLVLMAIATTIMTGPLVWAVYLRIFPNGEPDDEIIGLGPNALPDSHHGHEGHVDGNGDGVLGTVGVDMEAGGQGGSLKVGSASGKGHHQQQQSVGGAAPGVLGKAGSFKLQGAGSGEVGTPRVGGLDATPFAAPGAAAMLPTESFTDGPQQSRNPRSAVIGLARLAGSVESAGSAQWAAVERP